MKAVSSGIERRAWLFDRFGGCGYSGGGGVAGLRLMVAGYDSDGARDSQ